ncbi:Patellin-4 [Platanthera guangdongensis]|uniref:Patellin-4 n=1 Tax=Platanthera guangdongensis TaxID=2320717 RepID=A0ABR2N2M8_9ASPA
MTVEFKPEQTEMLASPAKEEEHPKPTAAEENRLVESQDTVEKRPSFKEESNFLSDLKDHERKALFELQNKLELQHIAEEKLLRKDANGDRDLSIWGVPLSSNNGNECTDVVLLKFLRARDFKVKDAFDMLRNTLLWRKENRVDSILGEGEGELGEEFGKAGFIDGVDRDGHPICYNVLGAFQDAEMSNMVFGSDEGRKKFLRSRVRLMEQGIKALDMRPGGVSSLLHVTDLKDALGFSKKEVRDTIKQAVQLLQDNYPELVARNIVINAPFWYYALNAILNPFLTQRTRSKFVVVRPAKVTETLLRYIPLEAIPTHYGGLKRENDIEFSREEGKVLELSIKASSFGTIEIPAHEARETLLWDFVVLGWEVNYKAEFVPADEGSYTVIVQKGRKIGGSQEEPIRNSYRNTEPGKIVLTIENSGLKKKRIFYRFKVKTVLSGES